MTSIRHRGPDSQGEFHDKAAQIWLAHVRLAIIDLSDAGRQPMTSPDGRVVLILNGEIYNFKELRANLEAEGYVFRGHSDTEVVLAQYMRDGANMLGKLQGIFALAIYDRSTQEVLIARDALGVKPLYYYETAGGVAFGSEIKGLLPFVAIRQINPGAIQRYLTYLWCPGDATALRGVKKVLPGEACILKRGRIDRRWTWYRLPIVQGFDVKVSPSEAVVALDSVLRRAVHDQLVSDVPVGAFLSGGLDSSAIVAFAREMCPELHCFTIENLGGRDYGEADDLPYARRVADHLGVSLNVVRVTAADLVTDIERMVYALDEPLGDPAPLNVLYISELARRNGIKVLLSGAGGDDVFSGYRRHAALRYEEIWRRLPRALRRALRTGVRTLNQDVPLVRRLSRFVQSAEASGPEKLIGYFQWADLGEISELFSPEVRGVLDSRDDADLPMLEFLRNVRPTASALERALALDQRFFLADHNLLYTDKMSMAAGVEVRVPFLDPRVVDFAASVPDKAKQRGMEGKWVLKRAMEAYLPRDVIYRPKTGFGAPLRRWLKNDLKELTADLLSDGSVRARGLFNSSSVRRLVDDTNSGRRDRAYTVFCLLCIEIWCRRFLD